MKRYFVIALVVVMALVMVVPSFAQTPVPTLALDSNQMQSGLFTGANIILVALGGVLFLIIGMTFGGKIIGMIQNAISNVKIG